MGQNWQFAAQPDGDRQGNREPRWTGLLGLHPEGNEERQAQDEESGPDRPGDVVSVSVDALQLGLFLDLGLFSAGGWLLHLQ